MQSRGSLILDWCPGARNTGTGHWRASRPRQHDSGDGGAWGGQRLEDHGRGDQHPGREDGGALRGPPGSGLPQPLLPKQLRHGLGLGPGSAWSRGGCPWHGCCAAGLRPSASLRAGALLCSPLGWHTLGEAAWGTVGTRGFLQGQRVPGTSLEQGGRPGLPLSNHLHAASHVDLEQLNEEGKHWGAGQVGALELSPDTISSTWPHGGPRASAQQVDLSHPWAHGRQKLVLQEPPLQGVSLAPLRGPGPLWLHAGPGLVPAAAARAKPWG